MNRDDLWKVHAACKDSPTDWWFPESSSPARVPRAICASCPVRVDCLQYALVGEAKAELYGVWGGAGERGRRYLRSLWVRSPHPDRVAGPEGCDCEFCAALVEHERRLAALAVGEPEGQPLVTYGAGAQHGRAVTYARGCRCDDCREAMRESRRQALARRKAAAGEDAGEVA